VPVGARTWPSTVPPLSLTTRSRSAAIWCPNA